MSEFTCISPERALELRSEGARIVDIRDPHSYATLHVAGAQRLDNQNIHDFIAAADLDAPLLVFCYHGHSSQSAAAFLAARASARSTASTAASKTGAPAIPSRPKVARPFNTMA